MLYNLYLHTLSMFLLLFLGHNLLILNISSLQLIPMTVIAYRSQYGSVNPTAIVGPGIVATAVSTLVAMIFCKIATGAGGGKE